MAHIGLHTFLFLRFFFLLFTVLASLLAYATPTVGTSKLASSHGWYDEAIDVCRRVRWDRSLDACVRLEKKTNDTKACCSSNTYLLCTYTNWRHVF